MKNIKAQLLWVLLVGTCGIATWTWSGHRTATLTFEQALKVLAHDTDEGRREAAVEVLRRRVFDTITVLRELSRDPGRVGVLATNALFDIGIR